MTINTAHSFRTSDLGWIFMEELVIHCVHGDRRSMRVCHERQWSKNGPRFWNLMLVSCIVNWFLTWFSKLPTVSYRQSLRLAHAVSLTVLMMLTCKFTLIPWGGRSFHYCQSLRTWRSPHYQSCQKFFHRENEIRNTSTLCLLTHHTHHYISQLQHMTAYRRSCQSTSFIYKYIHPYISLIIAHRESIPVIGTQIPGKREFEISFPGIPGMTGLTPCSHSDHEETC